eukprot:COSAG02_NODE_50093_length_322_cov_1.730942_1_plen_77_part_01
MQSQAPTSTSCLNELEHCGAGGPPVVCAAAARAPCAGPGLRPLVAGSEVVRCCVLERAVWTARRLWCSWRSLYWAGA